MQNDVSKGLAAAAEATEDFIFGFLRGIAPQREEFETINPIAEATKIVRLAQLFARLSDDEFKAFLSIIDTVKDVKGFTRDEMLQQGLAAAMLNAMYNGYDGEQIAIPTNAVTDQHGEGAAFIFQFCGDHLHCQKINSGEITRN